MKKEINPPELDFLLRFPAAPNTTSPVDFISHVGWGAIKTLSAMDEFRNLDRDIENNSKRWRKFVEAEAPEKEKFPQVSFLPIYLHVIYIILYNYHPIIKDLSSSLETF
jgi:dynein heavy chain